MSSIPYFSVNPLTIFLLVAVIVLLVVLVALSICSIVVCVHSTRKSGERESNNCTTWYY